MTARCLAIVMVAIMAFGSIGCSGAQVQPTDPQRDPWEAYNRKVHAFNMGVDRYLMKPVAKGYDTVMPDAPQRGVRNFFRNLSYPVTFLNLLLQGKPEAAMDATGRFLVNTTLGLGGFFDVASKGGLPRFDEDMGQTLAVWGWTESRYLVMPFIGPYTVRDLLGRSFYGYFHPISYMVREYDAYYLIAIDLVTLRAELLSFDIQIQNASDPYVLVRDVYLQNREFKIYDGEPPAPDYDALLEDF
ncbi:MAG: VacJ family lipoprotein [Xanthomonadales bacterium]|nr:VacJ family lipoprotein [Gammaproteobacteria bacterium]MBT8057087.1 VacJ family lipoprotein [Gammaproteobacteria bacterium]NNJ79379.1 VacJ family lipoprotein [Xanthomonadales bacterium]NNL06020.1 VacJ family lipoprotein [Xanthomonadales bacterium]